MAMDDADIRDSEIADEAMGGLITTLSAVEGSAPSWCQGWSAHDIAAHVAAAAQERADLIEEHLAGHAARPTRSWEEREPPFRALAHDQLRERLIREASRFERSVALMGPADSIVYTGWVMTADRLRTHSHSEAALHRWDLVGDDETSCRLLSAPALTGHAVAAFAALPALLEAQRWVKAEFTARPVRLRVAGQPDVLVERGSGLSMTPPTHGGLVIEIAASDRLLMLWGRTPATLRSAAGSAETVDDLLRGLCA